MNIKVMCIKGPQGIPLPLQLIANGVVTEIASIANPKGAMYNGLPIGFKAVRFTDSIILPMPYVFNEIPITYLLPTDVLLDQEVMNRNVASLVNIAKSENFISIDTKQYTMDGSNAVNIMKQTGGPGNYLRKRMALLEPKKSEQVVQPTQQPSKQDDATSAEVIRLKGMVEQYKSSLLQVSESLEESKSSLELALREVTTLKRSNNDLIDENKSLKDKVLNLEYEVQTLKTKVPEPKWEEPSIEIEEPKPIDTVASTSVYQDKPTDVKEETNELPSAPEPPGMENIETEDVKPVQEVVQAEVEQQTSQEEEIPVQPTVEQTSPVESQPQNINLQWEEKKVEQQPAQEQQAQEQQSQEQPTQTQENAGMSIAEILGIEDGNPWDIVDIVDSVVGFEDAKQATEAMKDWVQNDVYAESKNIQFGNRLSNFLQLPNHPTYNIPYILDRFLKSFNDLTLVYNMTKIRIKGEHVKVGEGGSKLYYGLPYLHFLFALSLELSYGIHPNSKDFYDRMMWFVRNVGSSRITNLNGEVEDTGLDDDDGEESFLVDQVTQEIATCKNGVSYMVQHLVSSLNGVEVKGRKLFGMDTIKYVFVMSEGGKPNIRVETNFLKKIGVGVVNFALAPGGLIATDKLHREISVDILGYVTLRHYYSEGNEFDDLTYDFVLDNFKTKLEINKQLDLNRFNKIGSVENIKFKFIGVVRLVTNIGNNQLSTPPMYILGEDISPTATTNRKHVLLPRIGNYLDDVSSYITFIEPVEIIKGNISAISSETIANWMKDKKEYIGVEVTIRDKIDSKKFNFTEDTLKTLSVTYRGLYIPEPAKDDVSITDNIIMTKNFYPKLIELRDKSR